MTDELVKRLRANASWGDDRFAEAADRIQALTAEHNATLARLAGAVAREIALTADNARLLDHAVDLFRQVRIATYSGMAVRREIPAVQIQILADIDAAEFCAALNGKEPSHEVS